MSQTLKAWTDCIANKSLPTPNEILISDDATSTKAVQSMGDSYNLDLLRTSLSEEIPIRLVNNDVRSNIHDQLVPSLGDLFAFASGSHAPFDALGSPYGGNHNLLLLLAEHTTVCMTDDDVTPGFRRLSSDIRGMGYQQAAPVSWDELERLSLPVSINEYEQLMSNFLSSSHSQIIHLAYHGDSGSPFPRHLYTARNRYFMDIEEPGSYDDCFHNNLVIRSGTEASNLMAGHFFIKPEAQKHPFSPHARNADGLWGFIAQQWHDIMSPDFSIQHKQNPPRQVSRQLMTEAKPQINELLILLCGKLMQENQIADGPQLGRHLTALADDGRAFDLAAKDLLISAAEARRNIIDQNIMAFQGEPFHWADDALSIFDSLEELIDNLSTGSWHQTLEMDRELTLKYISMYAQLLQRWEDLRAAVAIIDWRSLALTISK